MNPFGRLAREILDTEFDYITGSEETNLFNVTSGWLQTNVGQLNVLINTQFSSGNICAQPETGASASGWLMQAEEEAIYTQVYLKEYYQKEARKIIRNVVGTSDGSSTSGSSNDYTMTDWTSLREGDTHIQRQAIITSASSRNDAARLVKGLSEDAAEELKRLIQNYNLYNSFPRQVAGTDGE